MKEFVGQAIALVILIIGIYCVARMFGSESHPRQIPAGDAGYCTAYGDCY